MGREDALRWLARETPLDANAASNLLRYLEEQKEHTGALPTDRSVTVERFRDEIGDWRIAILTPFGGRVHAPWALAAQNLLSARAGFDVETTYTDDGIMLRFADVDALPALELLIPSPEEVEDRVVEELSGSALFATTFRESAARALLLPRRSPNRRTPLWLQRLRARNLLAAVRRYPSFPIVLETYRHCLKDVFDLPALREILSGIARGEIAVNDVSTGSASPFSRSLAFTYVASYLYEGDAPAAERKAQALALDRGLLKELLGDVELRDLIDAGVLEEVEAELSGVATGHRARSADELEDRLRRSGDLSLEELRVLSTSDPVPWIEKLSKELRIARLGIAGEERFVSVSDEERYRRGLLEEGRDLEEILLRFARRRGPFLAEEAARRYRLPQDRVERALASLASGERLVHGELRPSGTSMEWCDPDVLRRLKRRTLEKLRRQAAPVEASVLARFLPEWHGLGERRRGLPALEHAIAQLEGLPLPWSSLLEGVLPRRVEDFRVESLDHLSASGALVWVGAGALGGRDGRVVLYRRERARFLLGAPPPCDPASELEARILDELGRRGASFTVELAPRGDELSLQALEEALARLMWAGLVTNDTFFPLRNLGKARTRRPARRASLPRFAGGRWSLVAGLRDPSISDTEKAHARVTMLLERYGVVSRKAAEFEEIPGGFGAIYPLLREMEERGLLRRGHFVAGLPGSQFALPGAVERLRRCRDAEAEAEVDADDGGITPYLAVDPANPYGSILPWPSEGEGERGSRKARPRRVPGAWVVLHRGRLVLYLEKGGRRLVTFGEFAEPGVARRAIEALTKLPRVRPQRLRIAAIDDEPAATGRHAGLLRELGFFREAGSMVYAAHPRSDS
jgi:ATP-dependent Lhr-like helicase